MAQGNVPQDIDSNTMFGNGRGQKLYRWQLPDASNPKAVCVFIHGVGDHILSYEGVAKALWKNSNILLCGYDQVGHGRSEGERVDIKDFQHYVDDCLQFTDIVKGDYPNTPIFLMGHSMGGLVAVHSVLRKPEVYDGVILYAAAIVTNPKVVTPFKVTMAKVLSRIMPGFQVGNLPNNTLTRDAEEVKKLETDPLRWHGGLKARFGHKMLIAMSDFEQRMEEFKLPVLVVHGDADAVIHIDGSKKFYERASSTDKSLEVYPGCFHRLHTEPDGNAEKFLGDICRWILARC